MATVRSARPGHGASTSDLSLKPWPNPRQALGKPSLTTAPAKLHNRESQAPPHQNLGTPSSRSAHRARTKLPPFGIGPSALLGVASPSSHAQYGQTAFFV